MDVKTKTDTKFSLPTLLKPAGGLAVKAEGKGLASFSVSAARQKSALAGVLGEESVKTRMHKEEQAHKGLDLVLMGDLTGSMYAYHDVLKRKFSEICTTLFQLIPNLRIGIVFYLDHGSGDIYVTKVQPLTVNAAQLQSFISGTPDGNGGDADEAVEDALHDALEMNWSGINVKSVVLFGDARPHEVGACPYQHDYFDVVRALFRKQVTVNTVYCSPGCDSRRLPDLHKVDIGDFSRRVSCLGHAEFFSWIANVTGGGRDRRRADRRHCGHHQGDGREGRREDRRTGKGRAEIDASENPVPDAHQGTGETHRAEEETARVQMKRGDKLRNGTK